ncbi:hypothetical protein PUMCH_003852 [Australozyma saopauloensis]|uniref:1,3-beta-glucan synthase n=1 Tax=Australozyma saopauloensis TaxID=291208 RepID=A0AAX4HD03_9ASCO|nr:hypothetical protein PUMCH_003852 [[Candida] saopauloensis]
MEKFRKPLLKPKIGESSPGSLSRPTDTPESGDEFYEPAQENAFLGGDRTPFFSEGSRYSAAEAAHSSPNFRSSKYPELMELEAFSAWKQSEGATLPASEIKKIMMKLQKVFGFQEDSVRNIYEYLMTQLDSRALRMGPANALRTLHADYIGGANSNYRKWYFSTKMDMEDPVNRFVGGKGMRRGANEENELLDSEEHWNKAMVRLSETDYIVDIALYLLIWGEANNLRFMPECVCFIYKCCIDYYRGNLHQTSVSKPFLDHIITPIYLVLRQQSYSISEGKLTHIDKDHSSIIGYDDMNQLFWHREGISKIKVYGEQGSQSILEIQRHERYEALGFVRWGNVFLKTFRETRSWMHVIVNFSRVLHVHLAVFWIFTSFHSYPLYTSKYDVQFDNKPSTQVRLTVMALAGALLAIVSLFASFFEAHYAPRRWPGSYPIVWRILCLVLLLALNVTPTILIFALRLTRVGDKMGMLISVIHVILGGVTTLYLLFRQPVRLFGSRMKGLRLELSSQNFMSSFHRLSDTGELVSICLWLCVFSLKFVESYFFLSLPLKIPIKQLSTMRSQCLGDRWFGSTVCQLQPLIVLLLVYSLELVLFLLDTYLWYVIWNAAFSVFRALRIGTSIWTPWRNVFARLPKRMSSRLLVAAPHGKAQKLASVAELWNLIIIAMYRDHFISIEQVNKLVYPLDPDDQILEPAFFIAQEDSNDSLSILIAGSEAQRRIAFFAQSLTLSLPDVREVDTLPSFSVLIPHYSEKILLLLKEIVQEGDKYSHMTLLEYLKLLYPQEWENFMQDTAKMAKEEFEEGDETNSAFIDSLVLKDESPMYVLRTRVWALLRAQTLYRTVLGFMNYQRAIKILYNIEHNGKDNSTSTESHFKSLHQQACRKVRIVVAMQRYKDFSPEEHECTEILLSTHPEVKIAYIDQDFDIEKQEIVYYSCLIDGTCAKRAGRGRYPKFRIKLSGYPILGDGKADNQNLALIFCRGEYLQLIDANQDNYLEECLKIRSVLAEFEEQQMQDPYDSSSKKRIPVAIVGTREYIFSENTGILGDIAAGKEQTFGTLFARTLAQIGGKLHYGHPDFLNSVFMTTRGGVSKAQKGLHLNEDIYAGMTALIRGGRIKHCEYMQCGKGRDLGFTSILNFITKIGAGMGEQILSREYYFLGTQLRLDRLLLFYYAHLGFHLNNYFIILSIQLFLLTGINVAALTKESIICEYDASLPNSYPKNPPNCKDLIPLVVWLEKTVWSIFLVFILSLVPLAVHEVSERGLVKAITRTSKHVLSLSPLFEVFVCRIYAQSLGNDIAIGGAQYIATGRGFATTRSNFVDLYTRFGHELITFGALLILYVIYLSLSIWLYAYIFFWITISGFLFAPFVFNPGQFSATRFFVDYVSFIRWLYSGNRTNTPETWIEFTKIERSRLTGVKLKILYGSGKVKHTNFVRPSRVNVLLSKTLPKIISGLFVALAYLFANSQNESASGRPSQAATRIAIIALAPLCLNMALMVVVFVFNIVFGWILSIFISIYPAFIAAVARTLSILIHFVSLMYLWQFQNYHFAQTILGVALTCVIQDLIMELLTILMLSREVMDQRPNHAWWSGQWIKAGLSWRTLTQPWREFICKVTEQTQFAMDFVTGHLVFFAQTPLLIIPFINTWHTVMLMWIKPNTHLRQQPPRAKVSKGNVVFCGFVYISALICFALLVALVALIPIINWPALDILIPPVLKPLMQPIQRAGPIIKGLRKELFIKSRAQSV